MLRMITCRYKTCASEKRRGGLSRQSIVTELKRERDRVNRAIAELERVEANAAPAHMPAAPASSSKGYQRGSQLTPERRKKLSEAMKKRWAERRKKRA